MSHELNKKGFKNILLVSLGITLVLLLFFGIRFYLSGIEWNFKTVLLSALFSFTVSLLIYSTSIFIINKLQKKYPWQKNNVKRIILEAITTSFAAAFIMSVYYLLVVAIAGQPETEDSILVQLFDHIIIAVVITLIIAGVSEVNFILDQWKESLLQTEKLKRQNIEFKYSALTQQVNPHFLFNSFNTLASLIPDAPDKAVEFVNRFSGIYRYVLEVKDKIVIVLNEEINFINSYIFLQQSRYGNNLKFNIKVEARHLQKLVIPLSVQLLVENAIKHNEISIEKPLHIKIFCEDNNLIVSNNYQPRNTQNDTTGTGLENLTQRYQLVTDEKPIFVLKNKKYIAKIPLIED